MYPPSLGGWGGGILDKLSVNHFKNSAPLPRTSLEIFIAIRKLDTTIIYIFSKYCIHFSCKSTWGWGKLRTLLIHINPSTCPSIHPHNSSTLMALAGFKLPLDPRESMGSGRKHRPSIYAVAHSSTFFGCSRTKIWNPVWRTAGTLLLNIKHEKCPIIFCFLSLKAPFSLFAVF